MQIVAEVLRGTEAFPGRPGTAPVPGGALAFPPASRARQRDLAEIEATVLLADWLQPAIDVVDAVASRLGGEAQGVPTGFADLDILITGLHPGSLTVIGSRTGAGRSTLLLDFVRNAAIKHSMCSALFCLDQTGLDVVQRVLCAESRIRSDDMRGGLMSDGDWTRLARRVTEVHDAPLLLHRPDLHNRDDPRAGEADVIVAEHRNGPAATVAIAHRLHYSRFINLSG